MFNLGSLLLNFDWHAVVTGASTIIGSAATAGYMTWRRIQKNKKFHQLEVAKADAEIDVVRHLQDQRDYAMTEAKESKRSQLLSDHETQNAKAKVVALEAELAQLRQRVQLLSQLVTRLTTALDLTRNQLNNIIRKTKVSDEPHK